jgi:hypothetical protein
MGPVACIAQFVEATGSALGPAIASVSSLLDDAERSNSSSKQSKGIDVDWAHTVAISAGEHLDKPGGADGAHADALLSTAARAFALMRAAPGGKSPANPDALQYSLIRKLVARGAHAAALQQGWELFDALAAAGSGGGATGRPAAPKQQAAAQQLLAGAVINLVVCTAAVGLEDPGRLGAAAIRLADLLR